jgi:predicted anti-sigma-YlaC factor YlaD
VGNRAGSSDNHGPMSCDSVRAELSAALDGEQSLPLVAPVAEHLTACAGCQNWRDTAHLLTRRVRLTPARAIPDRTPQILDAVLADRAAHRRPHRGCRADRDRWLVRVGLAAAALAQCVMVLLSLVLGPAGTGIPPHAVHELGAFNLALAVGFAEAARRPARARGMFPLACVAAAALVVLAVVDSAYRQTTLLAELPDVITIAGAVLLHVLSRTGQSD